MQLISGELKKKYFNFQLKFAGFTIYIYLKILKLATEQIQYLRIL